MGDSSGCMLFRDGSHIEPPDESYWDTDGTLDNPYVPDASVERDGLPVSSAAGAACELITYPAYEPSMPGMRMLPLPAQPNGTSSTPTGRARAMHVSCTHQCICTYRDRSPTSSRCRKTSTAARHPFPAAGWTALPTVWRPGTC